MKEQFDSILCLFAKSCILRNAQKSMDFCSFRSTWSDALNITSLKYSYILRGFFWLCLNMHINCFSFFIV